MNSEKNKTILYYRGEQCFQRFTVLRLRALQPM